MKITIIAMGTRGDVQPIIALAKPLNKTGHDVSIVASTNFQTWIENHGIKATPTSLNFHDLMTSKEGHKWVEHGHNPTEYKQLTKIIFDQYGFGMMQDAWDACKDAEIVISSHSSQTYVASIAEKLRVKHFSMHLMPTFGRTNRLMAMSQMLLSDNSLDNKSLMNNWLIGQSLWYLLGDTNNHFRKKILSLNPQSFIESQRNLQQMLIVQGFSSYVVSNPSDLPTNIHTTGYWFLDEEREWKPSQTLIEFINAGDPPVFIGFGSMTGGNPEMLTQTIIDTLDLCGKRAILQSGWAGLGNIQLPPNIFLVHDPGVPHSWLFPRMSVLVHHGGAGTSAEGFRAGVPMVVIPHMADQSFWGDRVEALGIGPKPIPRHKLISNNLASAINKASKDSQMIDSATELGVKIRSENGVTKAAELIEKNMQKIL